MPYHIKTVSDIGLTNDNLYYVNENHWSQDYSERKIFSSKANATTAKNKKVEKNGYLYSPTKLKTSTIVSE
jgi:hypothetical protein